MVVLVVVILVECFDIFGVGGVDVGGGMNFEYGLFMMVVNGQVQFLFYVGVFVELGFNWMVEVVGCYCVIEVDFCFLNQDFIFVFYGYVVQCLLGELDCY